jgi:hypothetical protein
MQLINELLLFPNSSLKNLGVAYTLTNMVYCVCDEVSECSGSDSNLDEIYCDDSDSKSVVSSSKRLSFDAHTGHGAKERLDMI